MSDGPQPKRLRLSKDQLGEMGKNEIIDHFVSQDSYLDVLEAKAIDGQTDNFELVCLRESEEKMKQQQLDATRRENVLVMRLTTKEQEMQEYANQIQELKQAQIPGMSQLRSTLLDPAVNLMFERMKKELEATKAKLEETQNDLSAWKFTPDSNTGKRLMAKCRLLHQENEELGKIISSGRVAKLEADLALQRNFSEEMKKSQAELDEFLIEMDEDVEGMQSTIYYLQQQLREAKDAIAKLQLENQRLRSFQETNVIIKTENSSSVVEQAKSDKLIAYTENNVRTPGLLNAGGVVKEEIDSNSCSPPSLSPKNLTVKDRLRPAEGSVESEEADETFDQKPETMTMMNFLSESETKIRTPPSYSTPSSTLIISINEEDDDASLEIDLDTVDKTGDEATETNGDENGSQYTSDVSRSSPCTPRRKSPVCKEHSNGDDEENLSDVDSNSMDTYSHNCTSSSTVPAEENAVRHWSSVNGVTHENKSAE